MAKKKKKTTKKKTAKKKTTTKKKSAKKKKATKPVNKAESIRRYLKAHPEVMPSAVAKIVSKKLNVEISAQYVRTIRLNMERGR